MKWLTKMRLVAAPVGLWLPLAVMAGVLNDGYIMCSTKSGLDEGSRLVLDGKLHMLQSVGCYRTSSKFDGEVTDFGIMTSQVRLRFPSGESARVWVHTEALKKR